MPPQICHFLLTRFNVAFHSPDLQGDMQEHRGITEAWLETRFQVFEQFCLPSVLAQTNPDFHWLIFFDDRTPDRFKTRITELAAAHPLITPVYCSFFEQGTAIQAIRKLDLPAYTIRITSRLDNDDTLHPAYIARTQTLAARILANQPAAAPSPFFLSFPLGYSCRAGLCYLYRYRHNPFTSFISPVETDTIVLDEDHRYINRVAPVHFHWTVPLWAQIIHGENLANQLRGVYLPWITPRSTFPWPAGQPTAPLSFPAKCRETAISAMRYLQRKTR